MDQRWLDLLYYEKSSDGYVSTADDPAFFLTTDGKRNPKHEYDVSLLRTKEQDASFRKEFPLRYKYLALKNQIPYQPLVTSNPSIESVIIAFPNRFMGNPASMFGHLFIILKDKAGIAGSDVIHFLAETNGTDPSAYLYNGLFGIFKGQFIKEPFYKKIKEYDDVEDREVRYYDITLSKEQIENLQLHMIELKKTFFYYYFLDENCAYFTGKLLNIATERSILTKGVLLFPSQVINSLNDHGLLSTEWHRIPSSTLFNRLWNTLDGQGRRDVVSLYKVAQESVPTDSKTLRTFLSMADYMINNVPDLAQNIRQNRLLAYKTLAKQSKSEGYDQITAIKTVKPIVSNCIVMRYGSLNTIALEYNPICYGQSEKVESLESKSVNYLGSKVIFSEQAPPVFYFELAKVSNIPEWTPIRPELSWEINSQIGLHRHFFTNQSFEIGQSMIVTQHTLLIGMIGVNVSNYDNLLDTELSSLMIRPSVSVQLRHHLIQDIALATIHYENRYGQSRFSGKIDSHQGGYATVFETILSEVGQEFRVSLATFF